MDENNEKRHSTAGIDSHAPGVGGRQEQPPPPARGGGYPKKCEILNFRLTAEKNRDPRLDELREMGLQRAWLEVAEAIGVDSFLQVWRILDADKTNMADDGRRLVPMRGYSCYEKYQRNRFIEALIESGCTADQVAALLLERMGEKITTRHILRVARRG